MYIRVSTYSNLINTFNYYYLQKFQLKYSEAAQYIRKLSKNIDSGGVG